MRVRFLLMSSFHQGLDRGDGFDLGMLVSAASWMSAVRNFAALLRLVWLLWWWRTFQVIELASLRFLICLPKQSQSTYFQFHFSLGGVAGMVLSVELMSKRMSSWSEEVGLSSSIAQLEIRGVIW
jgi:hypothetical protein